MTFLLAAALLALSGYALLRLLGLATGAPVADAALGWLLGTGWFGVAAPLARFGLGLPLGRATTALLLALPVAAAAGLEVWRRRRAGAAGAEAAAPAPAEAAAKAVKAVAPPEAPRWRPRPLWVFAPMALYVLVVLAGVVLHGVNSPTHTDDGVRIRAYAPMLAFEDAWSAPARGVYTIAGGLPTFAPAVGWLLTGTVDHFHVNDAVLADLVALLALALCLGAARGRPERGLAQAFALLSIPLFVYHCTSTYSDAVLAMRVAAGVLLALEFARTRDVRDAGRAFLLLGVATLVKREGELVAAAPAAVLLGQLLWERWKERRPVPWTAPALALAPALLGALGKIAAVGLVAAFPMLGFLAQQAGLAGAPAPAQAPNLTGEAMAFFVDQALFRSGNAGMIFWVLPVAVVARARALLPSRQVWPLLGVGALFAEVAVSSIWIVPQFTVDQSTVHRALLVVSVPAAIWLAAALVDALAEDRARTGA